jgi:hypothetical protein
MTELRDYQVEAVVRPGTVREGQRSVGMRRRHASSSIRLIRRI